MPTAGRAGLLFAGLLDGDLALVHHLLDQVLEQLVHLLRRQVLEALHHLLEAVVVEQLALFERLLDGLLQIFERVLVQLAEGHVLGVEAAFQQEIGERLQQILGVDAEVLAGVLANSGSTS